MKVYEIVQNRIVKQIENAIQNGGTAPWKKPWKGEGIPKNYITRKHYRGINLLLLERGGSYITFNQIRSLHKKDSKIKLKKGSKSSPIIFWKFVDKDDDENDENKEKGYPICRYYNVFHISDVEGIELENIPTYDNDPINEAENIIRKYKNECDINILRGSERAYYTPALDKITSPSIEQFPEVEEYYSTLFHEMIHSTGHNKRLNRFSINDKTIFGSESYSKEELVAEIGSNMILSLLGIESKSQQENSISYLYGWLSRIKEDPKLITYASQRAQKACDYILDICKYNYKGEKELSYTV